MEQCDPTDVDLHRASVTVSKPRCCVRLFLTVGTYLGALVVVAVVAFVVVIVLAGPHAGLLPHSLEVIILGLGWASVLMLPVWAARLVWCRLGKSDRSETQVEQGGSQATGPSQ